SRRHNEFIALNVFVIPVRISIDSVDPLRVWFWRKRIAKWIGVDAERRLVHFVWLRERLAVHDDLLVDDLDMIARKSDDALDIVLRQILRVLEHDDVAAPDVLKRKKCVENRSTRAKRKFVHQQVVADQQVVFHRRRWNLERLDDEGRSKQRQDDRDDERFKV